MDAPKLNLENISLAARAKMKDLQDPIFVRADLACAKNERQCDTLRSTSCQNVVGRRARNIHQAAACAVCADLLLVSKIWQSILLEADDSAAVKMTIRVPFW